MILIRGNLKTLKGDTFKVQENISFFENHPSALRGKLKRKPEVVF